MSRFLSRILVGAALFLAACPPVGARPGGSDIPACERGDSCSEYPGTYWTDEDVEEMCESSAGDFTRDGCVSGEAAGSCTWWADDEPDREIVTWYDASYPDPEHHCDAVDGVWEQT